LQAKIGTLSLEGQAKLEQDTAKKEAKAEAKAEAVAKKKKVGHCYPSWIIWTLILHGQESTVTIKRIQRNKNKYVTAVHGLEAFGMPFCC
jgi:translation initiation factor 1 (eIF-1/SUI1)